MHSEPADRGATGNTGPDARRPLCSSGRGFQHSEVKGAGVVWCIHFPKDAESGRTVDFGVTVAVGLRGTAFQGRERLGLQTRDYRPEKGQSTRVFPYHTFLHFCKEGCVCYFSSGYGRWRKGSPSGRVPAPSHLKNPRVTLAVSEEPGWLSLPCRFPGLDAAVRQNVRKAVGWRIQYVGGVGPLGPQQV